MIRTFITPDGPFTATEHSLRIAAKKEVLYSEVVDVASLTNYMVSDIIIVDSFPLKDDEAEIERYFGRAVATARIRVGKFRPGYDPNTKKHVNTYYSL